MSQPVDYRFHVALIDGKLYDPWTAQGPAPAPQTVAHGLANLCRYGGHVKRFYSVAEHSLWMALYLACGGSDNDGFEFAADALAAECRCWLAPLDAASPNAAALALWGLVHDAPEGCGLVDMPSPVGRRYQMDDYRRAHERCLDWLCRAWGIAPPCFWPDAVHAADSGICGSEEAFRILGEEHRARIPAKPAWPRLDLAVKHDLSLLGTRYVREAWCAAYDALQKRAARP